jgi:hypothetical protein
MIDRNKFHQILLSSYAEGNLPVRAAQISGLPPPDVNLFSTMCTTKKGIQDMIDAEFCQPQRQKSASMLKEKPICVDKNSDTIFGISFLKPMR